MHLGRMLFAYLSIPVAANKRALNRELGAYVLCDIAAREMSSWGQPEPAAAADIAAMCEAPGDNPALPSSSPGGERESSPSDAEDVGADATSSLGSRCVVEDGAAKLPRKKRRLVN